jgi:hypothetical protein
VPGKEQRENKRQGAVDASTLWAVWKNRAARSGKRMDKSSPRSDQSNQYLRPRQG